MLIEIAIIACGGLFANVCGLNAAKNALNNVISTAFANVNKTLVFLGLVAFILATLTNGSFLATFRVILYILNWGYTAFALLCAWRHLHTSRNGTGKRLLVHTEQSLRTLALHSSIVLLLLTVSYHGNWPLSYLFEGFSHTYIIISAALGFLQKPILANRPIYAERDYKREAFLCDVGVEKEICYW